MTVAMPKGEITCVLGRTGCGKSTLLRMIAGLDEDFIGTIRIGESEKNRSEKCSLLLQESRVYPSLTAEENVVLVQKAKRGAAVAESKRLLQAVGMADRLNQKAGTLSGGEKTRVGIARALALRRPVLLLDEPFAALDECVRWEMAETIASIHGQGETTVVIVTHDQRLALRIASCLAVVDEAQHNVVQAGPTAEVYTFPKTLRVATYLYGQRLVVLQEEDCVGADSVWAQLISMFPRQMVDDGAPAHCEPRIATCKDSLYFHYSDIPGTIRLWSGVVPESIGPGGDEVLIRLRTGKAIAARNMSGTSGIRSGNIYVDLSKGWRLC